MVSNPRTKLGSDQFRKICKVYNPSTELGSDEVRNMVPNPRIKFGSDDFCNMSNNPKTGLGSDDFCSVNVVSDPKTVLGSDEFCNVDVVSSPRIHSGQTNLLQTTVSNPENRIRVSTASITHLSAAVLDLLSASSSAWSRFRTWLAPRAAPSVA